MNQLNIGDPALPAPVYRYRNMYTCCTLYVVAQTPEGNKGITERSYPTLET